MNVTRRATATGLALAACGAPAQTPEAPFDPNAPTAFPLRRAPGKRYLVDAAGRPFFIHGDVGWSMVANLRREEMDAYLTDRARRGVTVVQCKMIEKYHARNAPRNAYGEHPFGGRLDFRTPNDAYFAHFDFIVQRAAELGLLVMPAPAWLGFDGTTGGFYQEMVAAGAPALRACGQYLGRRYASARNILWQMGGDHTPPEKLLVRALAEGIREGGSAALMTVHCRAWQSSLDVWEGESWLDVNAVYTYGPIAETCHKAYRHPSQMPFFLFESTYEREGKNIAPHRIRQQAYEAVLAGGCGHVFGSNPLWYFHGPGPSGVMESDWRRGLDLAGSRHMQVVREVFRPLPWWRLAPDIDGDFLKAEGEGERPTAAVADNGAFALVYVPLPAALTLDLRRLTGPALRGRWVDPASGARTDAGPLPAAIHSFAQRPANAAGAGDWVLLLESAA